MAQDGLSRHERAVLRGLDFETRVTDLEDASDEIHDDVASVVTAVNRLTWAVGSGMFGLILVLVAALLATQ